MYDDRREIIEGHTAAVYGHAFSPDGKQIVSFENYNDRVIRVRNIGAGKKLFNFYIKARCCFCDFSADGKKVVLGDWSGYIYFSISRLKIESPIVNPKK